MGLNSASVWKILTAPFLNQVCASWCHWKTKPWGMMMRCGCAGIFLMLVKYGLSSIEMMRNSRKWDRTHPGSPMMLT
jgi:hypothetical protein